MKQSLSFFLVFGATALLPRAAGADVITDCTRVIRFLPVTINNPGIYCLESNASTSITTGAAITVNANDVTIDFKGHKIDGSAAGAGTLTLGVSAVNRRGLTVRNGRIRGFFFGVQTSGAGTVIEDLSLDSNTYGGISCDGSACTVRRNNIWNSGGASLPPPGVDAAYGIANYSDGGQTYDNTVSSFLNVTNQGPIGIQVGGGVGSIVRNNRVIGPDSTHGYGISVANLGSAVLISGNEVVSFKNGIDGGINPPTACRATSNRLFNVGTHLLVCADAGDNN